MASFDLFTSVLLNISGKENAYLDPGSGSFIIQIIIASLVGAGFLLRGYWSKIINLFRGSNSELDEDDENDLDNA
jgi:hypothetical protein